METNKNMVNQPQNQQPQQEEKKKKNKFVAWWLGLNKWAKVGICAGTAAVLATAITLPIVLTKKDNGGDGGTYEMKSTSDDYISDPINIKANYTYTFKLKIVENHPVQSFYLQKRVTEGDKGVKLKSGSVKNAQKNWTFDKEASVLKADQQEVKKDRELTFIVAVENTIDDVEAHGFKGGE